MRVKYQRVRRTSSRRGTCDVQDESRGGAKRRPQRCAGATDLEGRREQSCPGWEQQQRRRQRGHHPQHRLGARQQHAEHGRRHGVRQHHSGVDGDRGRSVPGQREQDVESRLGGEHEHSHLAGREAPLRQPNGGDGQQRSAEQERARRWCAAPCDHVRRSRDQQTRGRERQAARGPEAPSTGRHHGLSLRR